MASRAKERSGPSLSLSAGDAGVAASAIDIEALKRRSLHGSAATFAAQGIRLLLKLATQIFIARLLLPADYGLVAMVAPILALSYLLGELGLGQAIILQPKITSAEISSLFWFGLVLNVGLAAGLALLSPGIAWLYREPRTISITLVLAALLPISGLGAQHVALLNRDMRFGALAILDVVPPAIALIAGLTAARSQWGYWSLVAAAVAETLASVVFAWSMSNWRPSSPTRLCRIGHLLRVGSHITGYNLAGYATTSLENVLLGAVKGSAALGIYDRGFKLVTQPVTQMLMPVGRVAIPLLTRLRPDPGRFKSAYLDMLRIMLLTTTPGILMTMTMARPLALFLLGPQWESVAPVFAWLCLAGLVSPVYASTFWLFTTQDRTHRQMVYVAATSTISVIAFAAGLPWGPVGVAAGAALSFVLISTPLTCWGATKDGLVTPTEVLVALLPLIIAGSVTIGALQLVGPYLLGAGPAMLAVAAALSYAIFAGVLWSLPSGQPIVRRAWHFGTRLTHSWRMAA